MFEVSQGVLIFYNIYLSQLSHFVSNRSDERFCEYFSAFRYDEFLLYSIVIS